MADIVLSAASKVAEYLVAPVGRQCGYMIFSDSHVGQLKKELEKLEDAKVRVQRSVDDAQKNNLREITREVNRWKKEAETAANKARGVLDNDVRAKKTCFYGWLPNPKGRYRLGMDARKTVQDIESLILQGKFESVSYGSAPPGQVAGAPDVNSSVSDGGDTITDSRASIFQGIMKALDDEKLKVIGVYGPGGVGKTTLLEEVEKKLRKAGRPFHMIVKAKVSQTPDLKKIQYDIAYALSLNDLKDEPSEEGRRDLLFKRLQENPSEKVLIILDDLWAELDLKAVGIPSGDVSGKCKLLLTSRFGDVLEQKMRADRTFLLEGLNKVEAFRLFEKTVGDKLKENEELKAMAAQVVEKLAGLPLLIISVATNLKYRRMSAWKKALKKINNEKVETIVKLSYDHLESDDTRSLFLLCGLIGGTIQVELLLGLGMGLDFEGFNNTIEESRDILNDMLDELCSVCLLQDGGDDRENVTIHDLYSEVVVSNAFNGQHSLMINSNYGSWPKEKLEKCWACHLVNVGNDRLAELMPCRFPHTKILMLSEQYEMGDCSRMDFTHMKELRALRLCSMSITSLPSSMEILGNLRSLSINCYVENVAILGKLKALRILSFAWSTISRLPKEIGELTNLQSLNLSYCYSLEIIEPGALKGLINLEELHMKGTPVQWMGKHEIPSESCGTGLAELKSLTNLTSLEISIHHPIILLEDGDLPFGNLVRFWITMGVNTKARKFKGLKTMELNLEGCDNILSREWVQKALQKTQYLYLCKLSEFKKSAHELCTQGFRELKHLDIDDSPSIKYIANSSDGLPLTAFVKLESLFLANLINLEKIYHGPIAPECFSKLKAVNVRWCGQLKYLWRLSDMQRFVQLEEIEVQKCDSMRSFVTHDDAGEEIASVVVPMSNVRRLVLHQLPNMKSFCARAEITSEDAPIQVSFPRLESLELGMVGLLDLEKILFGQPPLEYSNLKSIKIRESRSKSFFKSDWIPKLPNLESLKIRRSPSVEAVFDLGELKITRDVKILSQLMELKIKESPNLRCMWKQDVKLQGISVFQSLKKLVVKQTGLAFLFPVSVAKCLRELRDIEVKDCPNMKAVIVDEEGRDEGTNDVIEFPLLKGLLICNCPMEKFFSYPRGNKEPVTTTSDSQDTHSDSFFDQKVTFPNIISLEIEGVQCKELWNNQIPTDSFSKLKSLELKNCNNLQRITPSHMWKRLQCCLENLLVISCRSIEIIYEGDGTDTVSGKLGSLVLRDLKNLRHIWQFDGLPNIPIPNLRSVTAVRCSRLKMLFPTFTAEFLGQIEELVVESCGDMELIAGHGKWEEATGTTITFSELTVLRLFNLPKFRSFLPEKYSLKSPRSEDFPSLRYLSIVSCGAEPDRVAWIGPGELRTLREDRTEEKQSHVRTRYSRSANPL